MKYTGIPINFGIAVVLGFIVGTAIAGQTFYNFTLDNLRHFGALKAMGAGNGLLLRMILLQAVLVGVIGYGLGVGAASAVRLPDRQDANWRSSCRGNCWPSARRPSRVICIFSALLSIAKVIRLEPAIVFKG